MTERFKKNWKNRRFLVANRTDAVLYRDTANGEFSFVRRLENPSGRKTDSELVSDRSGSKASSAGGGTIRHALDRRDDHHEVIARKFALRIAKMLERERTNESYDELVLVAEPHFLGLLRKVLPPTLQSLVNEEIRKEFVSGSDREIRRQIVKASG